MTPGDAIPVPHAGVARAPGDLPKTATLENRDMGSRGPLPRRDSTESRRGRNTYRARPVRVPIEVPPPANVAANPFALAFWHEHADTLIAAGPLRPEFADTLGLLAVMVAD